MEVLWHDNFNTPYRGTIDVTPGRGVGSGQVVISSELNEGLDRFCVFSVSSTNYYAVGEFEIQQKGAREVVATKDEEVVGLLNDGTVNVLKNK